MVANNQDYDWKVGQLYKSTYWSPSEYVKVIAIGDEKVFVQRFIVKEKVKFFDVLRKILSLPAKRVVEVSYIETTYNKESGSFTPVENISEIVGAYQTIYYNEDEGNPLEYFKWSGDYWTVGETYTTHVSDVNYKLLGVGYMKCFFRLDNGAEVAKKKSSVFKKNY